MGDGKGCTNPVKKCIDLWLLPMLLLLGVGIAGIVLGQQIDHETSQIIFIAGIVVTVVASILLCCKWGLYRLLM